MVAMKWLASKWLRLAIIAGLSCLLFFILVSLPRRTARIFYLFQEGPVNELDQHKSTSDQYSNDGLNPNHDSPVVENQWIDSDSKGVKINSNYPSPVENQWIDIDSKGVTMVSTMSKGATKFNFALVAVLILTNDFYYSFE